MTGKLVVPEGWAVAQWAFYDRNATGDFASNVMIQHRLDVSAETDIVDVIAIDTESLAASLSGYEQRSNDAFDVEGEALASVVYQHVDQGRILQHRLVYFREGSATYMATAACLPPNGSKLDEVLRRVLASSQHMR